ncbi:MAG TPA: 50S ribosomal protein L4 [Candidatus Wallbacteria bacterium]|nr:50S ribosomal protein L4 [Candidatus Wallbacteria bacterium]
MPTIEVLNIQGKVVEKMEVSAIFETELHKQVITDCLIQEQANKRQGNASVKDRAAVSGGGKKPWRQKGTARARHGSSRSPIWRHGGVTFGPEVRSYYYTIPKKIKRLAMCSVLADKLRSGNLVIVDAFNPKEFKTKEMAKVLVNLKINEAKNLIVTKESDEKIFRSFRNIPRLNVLPSNSISVYPIVWAEKLVMTKDALLKIEEVLK